MAGKLTKKHSINSAIEFVDSVSSTNSSYFMFTAHHEPWTNENSPPITNTSISAIEHTIHDHLLFGKRVTTNDVKFMVPRYDWTSNTIYDAYDKDDGELYTKDFFVITDEKNVYKVLDNNGGLPSIVKPVLKSNTTFKTSDNYVWKYMFSIDDTTMRDFATRTYIPIVPNTSIQQAALPGSIDVIRVESSGSGWITFNTGFLQSVVSADAVVINAAASTNNDFYTNSSIYLKNGLGAGQIRKIISYNGTTKTVGVEPPLDFGYNFEVANVVGQFTVGDVISQQSVDLLCGSVSGTIDVGDTITQSVTGATGTVIRSREGGTKLFVNRTSGSFALNLPIDSGDTAVTGNGTVTANTTSNTVVGNNTVFTTLFPTASLPHYIEIGPYTRRVTAVTNATHLTVEGTTSGGFDENFIANTYYRIPSAAKVLDVTTAIGSGTIVFTDLDSVNLTISNKTGNFVVGENVVQPDSASNGTIIFANNTVLILSDVQGPGFRSSNNASINLLFSGNTLPFVNNELILQNISGATGTITFANSSYMSLTNLSGTFSNDVGYFITGGTSSANASVGQIISTIFTVQGLSTAATANVIAVYERPTITVQDTVGQFRLGSQITGSIGGIASIKTISTLPDEDTEYVISPTVDITGDGSGARAYSIINTTAYSVDSIVVFDPGRGYTEANVVLLANSNYGTGANLVASISPVDGHGAEPIYELGANYVMVKTSFGSANSENYDFPSYGSYRAVGLMKDPLYNDLTINIPTSNGNYSHGSLIVNNIIGTFQTEEVIYQANTKSSAIIQLKSSVGTNNYFEISRIQGQFSANNANDKIIGLLSGASANVRVTDINIFSRNPGVQPIFQQNTGAKGVLVTAAEEYIKVTNAAGVFQIGKIVYDPSTNTYANTNTFKLAGNTKPTAFTRFTQLGRITLSSNATPFSNNERIELRAPLVDTKIADAVIYSNKDEVDLKISGNTIPFSNSETVIQTGSGAQGVIRSANSTFIKLTSVAGTFSNTANIDLIGQTSSANASIERVYPALVVADMDGPWATSSFNYIIGLTSGSTGFAALANTIILPEMVRDSGDVLYIENREYVERTPTTSETVRLLIRF